MSSTILDPVAAALVSKLATIAGLSAGAIKSVKWDPGMSGLPTLPAGVVGMPTFERTEPDEAEDHLGANDWRLEYPVALVFDLSQAERDQARAVEYVEAFVVAVDADQTLSNGGSPLVQEAKVTFGEPEIVEDEARPMIVYRTRVRVLQFV